jgi:hypothetical protein
VNQMGTRTRERGAGAEEDGHRREHLPAYVHLFTEPATTTPPPYSEHRPATLMSSPPWSSSCDGSAMSRHVAR